MRRATRFVLRYFFSRWIRLALGMLEIRLKCVALCREYEYFESILPIRTCVQWSTGNTEYECCILRQPRLFQWNKHKMWLTKEPQKRQQTKLECIISKFFVTVRPLTTTKKRHTQARGKTAQTVPRMWPASDWDRRNTSTKHSHWPIQLWKSQLKRCFACQCLVDTMCCPLVQVRCALIKLSTSQG